MFWMAQGLAVCAALLAVLWRSSSGWDGSLGTALWLSLGATLAVYIVTTLLRRDAVGLLPLLAPYLLGLALIATALDLVSRLGGYVGGVLPGQPLAMTPGVVAHVGVSLLTYALTTVAALAGLAVMFRERALKSRSEPSFLKMLPALRPAESLQFRSLALAELVLGLGILTGTALEVSASGNWFVLDHKTLLSVVAFVTLGVLLVIHRFAGLRGQRAARFVLAAYLLLTLAYPGVKAVQQLLSS